MNRRGFLGMVVALPAVPVVASVRDEAALEVVPEGPWIHFVGDGRGTREVYLDDRPVDGVIYADERRGIVRRYVTPMRVVNDECVTEELRGSVRVTPWRGSN
jgi:hypothetical protein